MAPIVVNEDSEIGDPQELEFAHFEDEDEEVGASDGEAGNADDKDSTEEELEKLVFGDSVGFRASLKRSQQVAISSSRPDEGEEKEGETGLEETQDADVCGHRSFYGRTTR